MKDQIVPFIPEGFNEIRQTQEKEMGVGGNDFIKLDRAPLEVAGEDFKGISEFKTTYTLLLNTQQTVTFPLMENPDGIVCHQDAKKALHFYYANRETKDT